MKTVSFLIAALLCLAKAHAQHETFTVDPSTSEVMMKLNTTHEVVSGTFHVESGTVDFDGETRRMAGTIVVAAGSGSRGNGMRDKKMNKDILKVDQFTSVSFAPKTYQGTLAAAGDSSIRVTGAFTLLGIPHDLVVPMQVHVEGTRATAKRQFDVPYVQWGLTNPSFLFWKAENDVLITVSLVGHLGE